MNDQASTSSKIQSLILARCQNNAVLRLFSANFCNSFSLLCCSSVYPWLEDGALVL